MKRRLFITILLSLVLIAQPVLAGDEDYDPARINYEMNNDIIYRDNGNEELNEGAICSATGIPPTTTTIDNKTMNNINGLRGVYMEGERLTNVRWEIIAAIDYRESSNNPQKSILGGEPLGQKAKDSDYAPNTKLESIQDGMDILKRKKDIYGVDPTQQLTYEQLQNAFVSYNRGNAYAVANVPADKSPYVMNRYDSTHKNMYYPNIPGETLADKDYANPDTRYGAMTIFANLIDADQSDCIAGGVGDPVDYSQLIGKILPGTLHQSDKKLLCSPRPDQPGFKLLAGPACESFKAMDIDYKRVFGKRMPVGGGYRTKEAQIACGGTEAHPKNGACTYYSEHSTPPSHLWGTAIDFAGVLFTDNTREHDWLVRNGPKYGWFWPNWAQDGQGGNAQVREPWHFGYYFVGHDPEKDSLEKLK